MKEVKDVGEQTWYFEETVEEEHGFLDTEMGRIVETGGRAWFCRHRKGSYCRDGGEHGFVSTKEGGNISVAYPVTLHPF